MMFSVGTRGSFQSIRNRAYVHDKHANNNQFVMERERESRMGIVAVPLIGFYCATKWAVEALHETLAQDVKSFGISVHYYRRRHSIAAERGAAAGEARKNRVVGRRWNSLTG